MPTPPRAGCRRRSAVALLRAVYDTCPDHGLPGDRVCDSCVRPLCRKCKVKGSLSRCAECQAAREKERDPDAFRPSAGSESSRAVVVALLVALAVMLYFNTRACPPLPNITWLK